MALAALFKFHPDFTFKLISHYELPTSTTRASCCWPLYSSTAAVGVGWLALGHLGISYKRHEEETQSLHHIANGNCCWNQKTVCLILLGPLCFCDFLFFYFLCPVFTQANEWATQDLTSASAGKHSARHVWPSQSYSAALWSADMSHDHMKVTRFSKLIGSRQAVPIKQALLCTDPGLQYNSYQVRIFAGN